MIKIICVGKQKEKYLTEATEEYIKRIKKYTNIEIIEIEDCKIDNEKTALEKEKKQLLKHLNPKDYVITLEIDGKQYDSIEFANQLDKISICASNICFIIGSSYGLHKEVKEKANHKISFSKMTFPHQLFRVMLLEQIYRSYKILHNERYHK